MATVSVRPSFGQSSQSDIIDTSLKVIYLPTSPLAATVDLVAIHGLIEPGEQAWTWLGTNSKARHLTRTEQLATDSVENSRRSSMSEVHGTKLAQGTTSPRNERAGSPSRVKDRRSNSFVPQQSGAQAENREDGEPKGHQTNWLKDGNMLQDAVPHARIMVFQYLTMMASLNQNIEANERLTQIAQELIRDLGEKRQDAAGRPIIFIGHGFGGIVIERALVLAGEEERKDILDSTLGLVFLGTPFRGSEAAVRRAELEDSKRLSKFITALNTQSRRFFNQKLDPTPRHVRRLAALQLPSPTFGAGSSRRRGGNESHPSLSVAVPLYKLMDPGENGEQLISLLEDFKRRVTEKNIRLTCFTEEIPTEIGDSTKGLVVERDSGTIAGFPSISLPSTHSNLSKFRGPYDPDYRCVVSTLKQYILFAPTKRLWGAIRDGNEDEVDKLLRQHASPTIQDLQGRSALHYAAEECNKVIMKKILLATSRIDLRDNKGRTALQIAAEKECTDIVNLLFERGAYLEEEFKDIPENMRQYLGGKPRKLKGPARHGVQKKDVKLDDCLEGACKAFSLTYTEFYWNHLERSNEDKENRLISEKNIYETLYVRQVEDNSSNGQPEQPQNHETPSWRWYHIPANNLVWVEALFDHLGIENSDQKLFGERHCSSTIHSRFIKPKAETLKRKWKNPKRGSEGFDVTMLFMPYLHFETFSGRQKLTEIIDDVSESAARDKTTAKIQLASRVDVQNDRTINSGRRLHSRDLVKRATTMKSFIADDVSTGQTEGTPDLKDENDLNNEKLIKAYINHQPPLHARRTLDQFYYAGMLNTKRRDETQVVTRYVKRLFSRRKRKIEKGELDEGIRNNKRYGEDEELEEDEEDPDDDVDLDAALYDHKVIMVDELWLWVIGEDIVVTCFPQPWNTRRGAKNEVCGVLETIEEHLKDQERDFLESASDLAGLIIRHCSGAVDRTKVSGDDGPLDIFEHSIASLSSKELRRFERLKHLSKKFREPDNGGIQKSGSFWSRGESGRRYISGEEKIEMRKELFDISMEISIIHEIRDIRDELNMMRHVLDDQNRVLLNLYGKDHEGKPKGPGKVLLEDLSEESESICRVYLDGNSMIVDRLSRDANEVYDAIDRLLNLKQKQANAWEARWAGESAESTSQQGKTVLFFTIVTSVFLPLSFIASIFSINIVEFPDQIHLDWVSQYIFGISIPLSIILVTLVLTMDFQMKLITKYLVPWTERSPRSVLSFIYNVAVYTLIFIGISLFAILWAFFWLFQSLFNVLLRRFGRLKEAGDSGSGGGGGGGDLETGSGSKSGDAGQVGAQPQGIGGGASGVSPEKA